MAKKEFDEDEALAAKFIEEGIPVDVAGTLAKIALRNDSSVSRPTIEATDEVINKIAARFVDTLGERADLEKRKQLKQDLKDWFISFSASAAFGIVQYILVVLDVFTASAEPKSHDDLMEGRIAKRDAIHHRLSQADRTFLSNNLESLSKVHKAFRSEVVEAIRRSGIAGGGEQLIALSAASLIEEHVVDSVESNWAS